MRKIMPRTFVVWVLKAVLVAAALAVTVHGADKKKVAAPPSLVWPVPPETPRIRYVTAYHGVDDFAKKSGGRWKSLLLGAEVEKQSTQLMKPYGIAVARDGRVFVTDTGARRVVVFERA